MALYHKWDVKNGFAFVLQNFLLISDGLGGVISVSSVKGVSDIEMCMDCFFTSRQKL